MSRCPHAREAADAGSGSGSVAIVRHARSCPECAGDLALNARLAELAEVVAPAEIESERAAAIRGALLARVRAEPQFDEAARSSIPGRRIVAFGAAAAVLVVVGAAYAWRSVAPAEPAFRATVATDREARFTHTREEGDERVSLAEGRIRVHVEHMREGERFRVLTDDAEVEVRGTVFEVIAKDRRLAAVRVLEGAVDVRRPPRAAVRLKAGESWVVPPQQVERPVAAPEPPNVAEPPPTAAAPPPPRALPQAMPRRAPAIARQLAKTPDAQPEAPSSFDAAWDAMRSGDFGRAADLFAQAESELPAAGEEASYGRTIALARAGRQDEAIRAMESYLSRYPEAPRRGTIAVALGWLLLDAGDPEGAERQFASAVEDPAAPVREAARQGLAAARSR